MRSRSIFNQLFYSILVFLCMPCSFLLHATSPDPKELAFFWWKEGDFVNFGDYISCKLVERILGKSVYCYNKKSPNQVKKLLASGSIYYFANEGDVIWGSGINGKKMKRSDYSFNQLDIRSVRGPLTRDFLMKTFKIDVPEIYGDPALLFPFFFPEFKKAENPEHEHLIIAHYHDISHFIDDDNICIVHATEPWDQIVKAILNSKFVISTALHGVILAEAYGIPARLLRLGETEPLFKFVDYYEGTGRPNFNFATSVEEALLMGGEPPIQCDLQEIYNAFPFEYWQNITFPKIDLTKAGF